MVWLKGIARTLFEKPQPFRKLYFLSALSDESNKHLRNKPCDLCYLYFEMLFHFVYQCPNNGVKYIFDKRASFVLLPILDDVPSHEVFCNVL